MKSIAYVLIIGLQLISLIKGLSASGTFAAKSASAKAFETQHLCFKMARASTGAAGADGVFAVSFLQARKCAYAGTSLETCTSGNAIFFGSDWKTWTRWSMGLYSKSI